MTSVFVPNPSDAFVFYTDMLGFVQGMHLPEAALAIAASLKDPAGTGLLLEPNNP